MKILTFKQFINENTDIDTKLKKLGLKRTNKFNKIGKEIGGEIYCHKQYESQFPSDLLNKAKSNLPTDYKYKVVKFNPKTETFSFIQSNDFDSNEEPSVNSYVTVKADGTIKQGKDAGFIYHHKWEFVGDDYKNFDVEKSKKRSLKWSSLDSVDKSRIGQRKFWDANVIPRLQENDQKLTFNKVRYEDIDDEGEDISGYYFNAYVNDKQIGFAFVPDENINDTTFSVGNVDVDLEFRKQGIANKIYDYAEKSLKRKVIPSNVRTPEGKGLWNKRNKIKESINEKISLDEIIKNPSISELKDLIKVSTYHSIRFTINSNNDLKAGDAEKYTHQEIEPAFMTVKIRGMIRYKEGKYLVKAYGAYDQKEKQHPKVDEMIKAGMVNEYDNQ